MMKDLCCSKLNVMSRRMENYWLGMKKVIDSIYSEDTREVILVGRAINDYALFEKIIRYCMSKRMHVMYLTNNQAYDNFDIIKETNEKICFRADMDRYADDSDKSSDLDKAHLYASIKRYSKNSIVLL